MKPIDKARQIAKELRTHALHVRAKERNKTLEEAARVVEKLRDEYPPTARLPLLEAEHLIRQLKVRL